MRQFAAQQGERVAPRVGPLRYGQFAEILPRGAGRAHVGIGDQRETRIRSAGAVGIHRVTCETC